MDPNIAWAIVNAVVPFVGGLGVQMAGLSPASFRAARVCFWTAAVWLVGSTTVWTFYADLPPTQRFAVAAVVLVFAAVALIACLRWVAMREALVTVPSTVEPAPSGNQPPARRPRVTMTGGFTTGGFPKEPLPLKVCNTGDVAAHDVTARITFTDPTIRLELDDKQFQIVLPTPHPCVPAHFYEVNNGIERPVRDMKDALTSLLHMVLGRGVLTTLANYKSASAEFDVNYTDHEGKWSYSTPHRFEFRPKVDLRRGTTITVRVDKSSARPEPQPQPRNSGLPTADEIAAAIQKRAEPTQEARTKRRALRATLSAFLIKGDTLRTNLRFAAEPQRSAVAGDIQPPEVVAMKATSAIDQWDRNVADFIRAELGNDRAAWFYARSPAPPYPAQIATRGTSEAVGREWFERAWDTVHSNMGKLEQLLREYPEL